MFFANSVNQLLDQIYNLKFFLQYSLICIIFAIPALYLFSIWGGLLPPDSQFRITFWPTGINFFFSIVGIYFLPIFIVLVIEKKIANLFLNLKKFDLIIFFIAAVILFFTLPENPRYDGVGIIYKFLSLLSYKLNLNWNVILYLYYISNLFFLILIITFLTKNFKNYVFLVIYAFGFMWTHVVHQQYVDPLFFILIFCYFNFVNQIKVTNVKYILTFSLFYLFMLLGAVYYRSICSVYFLGAACQVQ